MFTALMLVFIAAATAEPDIAHIADDVDGSENDAEDYNGFTFAKEPEIKSFAMSASSESGAVSILPRPQPQNVNYLSYNENLNTNLFSGAATYTYPVEALPGANGFEPSILFYYNHHGTRGVPGILGTSWSMSQSAIYRDINYTRSNTSDDFFVISFNGINERLVYDGSRYRTEHDTYLFI